MNLIEIILDQLKKYPKTKDLTPQQQEMLANRIIANRIQKLTKEKIFANSKTNPMKFFKNLFKADPEVDYQMALKAEIIEGNDKKAAWLYKKAAENGHAGGQFYYGFMLLNGRGVNKNISIAVSFIKASAEQNYYKAQYLIAQMYYSGIGVEKDTSKADSWMEKFNLHHKNPEKLSFLNFYE